MSVEFWLNAEKFYEFWFVIIISLLTLNIIFVIFVYTYMSNEKRNKAITILVISAVLLSSIGLYKHSQYYSYLEQASYINPLIRDRTPSFIGYNYYSSVEENVYSQYNDLDSLRKMALYNETQVSESIVYLGEGNHSHYFKHSNGNLFRHNMDLKFIEGIEQSQMVGSQFHLKDESFKSIGFKNPKNIMFDYIEIPASEKGKKYTPENERQFLRMEKVIKGWNF